MKISTVEVANEQVMAAYAALQEVAAIKLPPLSALKIARLIDALERLARIIGTIHSALVSEHALYQDGELVHPLLSSGEPDRSQVSIRPEQLEKFTKQMSELIGEKNTLEAPLLTIDDLMVSGPDETPISLKPDTLRRIGPFLVDQAQPKE